MVAAGVEGATAVRNCSDHTEEQEEESPIKPTNQKARRGAAVAAGAMLKRACNTLTALSEDEGTGDDPNQGKPRSLKADEADSDISFDAKEEADTPPAAACSKDAPAATSAPKKKQRMSGKHVQVGT